MKTFSRFLIEATDPKGPIKKYMSPEEIAKKHKISLETLNSQLDMGIKVESEHTGSKKMARMIALQHLEELPDYYSRLKKAEKIKEEGLLAWFGQSKSKGKKGKKGKRGWVDVVDGDACAREEGETATPKCVPSWRRASMSKEERLAAQARKRRQDPNQPQKSGAAKPTYVKTDYTPEGDMNLQEIKDRPGKGSGKKDACYHKVKSRYRVWPSAYASGALVKCRKVGADSWGTKSESTDALAYDWDGPIYEGEKRYCPNCKKMESMRECKYGPKSWLLYSSAIEPTFPTISISNKKYDPNRPHPANEEIKYNYSDNKIKNIREIYTRIQSRGSTYSIMFNWRGRYLSAQMFFPQFTRPSKQQVTYELRKIYPDAIVLSFNPSIKDPTKPLLFTGELDGSR
jgi:hypothetical protein